MIDLAVSDKLLRVQVVLSMSKHKTYKEAKPVLH